MTDDWRSRVDAVWADASNRPDPEVAAAIDALVAERAADDPEALFEAASARDFTDREAEAEPLYRAALDGGLEEPLRGRALIQLASTLRNLGRADEAVDVLLLGFADQADHPLRADADAFLAMALLDAGAPRAALEVALHALAPHLREYGRVVDRYADALN